MNDLLEFLGVDKKEKEFSEHGLKKIVEVLKNFSIYEYKVISNKLMFHFCNQEYLIINNDNKYNVEIGYKFTLPHSLEDTIKSISIILSNSRIFAIWEDEKKYTKQIGFLYKTSSPPDYVIAEYKIEKEFDNE